MGSLIGHVAPGIGFLIVGLWHLFNHTKLHSLRPKSYIAPPWFPTPKLRYAEFFLVIAGGCTLIVMDFFVSPRKHHPLDDDGTIPSHHIHTFEHGIIALTFINYGVSAIMLDSARPRPRARVELTVFVGAITLSQQLLVFHLHHTDHIGIEGQFHWLLQVVIFVSLTTTLLGIGFPRSFTIAFVRSASLVLQGIWFITMGFIIWTPRLNPKGCFLEIYDSRKILRCHDAASLDRAKSLINVIFSWLLAGWGIFMVSFYLFMVKKYPEVPDYTKLVTDGEEQEDLELQKKLGESQSFVHFGKGMRSMELGR